MVKLSSDAVEMCLMTKQECRCANHKTILFPDLLMG